MALDRFKLIAAVHLFLVRGDQILMLLRKNTGYEDGNYSVVAGHLDGGEEVIQASIREAREEAGILIRPEDVRVTGVMHRLSTEERIDFFVTVRMWEGEVRNMEPDKCGELRWFPLEGLPSNVIPYVRRALENGTESHWFDSFGWDT